ncbi:hypothetical protein [Mycobacteroides abscessus]|uniref:hypothetical protein n=1 Tax=Mycobacteroides abscessus TaxID=36809 RepID=UPI000927184D|nr:hypothetical protein [Mycobacteroides abscessus]MBN7296638.1 hypothetical protein [Mycobacteroides abscessus subsp. abscessus]SHR97655.1 Uncharacterised protein [Mycobacteroides abscessus subsp. abscessus]
MSKFGFVTATFAAAAVAASCTAAPAVAEPCVVDALGRVATNFPPGCTPSPAAPTTTAPSTGSGSGVTGWIDGHMPLIIGIVVVVLIVAVTRSVARDKEKAAAEQQQADLDRGRGIALDHHAADVQRVREAAAWSAPDPSTYDPMGLGVAPPQMPEPDLPAAPPQSPADLKRYSTFGAVVPWEPGTAFAAVVARDGDIARAEQAWIEACRAARLGETDSETGAFTPTAELTNVRNVVGSGDVELVVLPADLFTGDVQLNRVIPYLVRTARVRWSGVFEREHTSDSFVIRLSNTDPAAQAPGAPQQQAPADPVSGWEW